MQAYETKPCPGCGAWNRVDAVACYGCQRPLVAAPAKPRSHRKLLFAIGGLLIVAAIAGLAVVPAMASNELSADQDAIAATYTRQASVDAAMATFLTPLDPRTGHGGINDSDLHLEQYQSALSSVRADQLHLQEIDHQLEWMGTIAVGKQSQISQARRQNQAILAALRQADGALVAAVDQATVIRTMKDLQPLYTKMTNAAKANDYTTVETVYAEADRKLGVAEALVLKPDMPNGVQAAVRALRAALDDTEKLIIADRNHDQFVGHTAYVALEADLQNMKQYGDDFSAKWDAWNVRNLQPIVAAYDQELRGARAGN